MGSSLSSRFPRRRRSLPSTAIGSVPNLSGHAIAYRWRSLPRVRRHKASKPQGCSSNGCFLQLIRKTHGPIFMRTSFPPQSDCTSLFRRRSLNFHVRRTGWKLEYSTYCYNQPSTFCTAACITPNIKSKVR